ncbi:baseplate J/gp47 family protein [Reichenbachiella versicolor]|uniref:baseplate J/gp47 family protein n=1 Tax=Reichenbachiella versicolor TaxID=1821036 RepID=UPI000D6E68B4|nr:baseplate J/gp47 family protein [Reichenbachiella versicolor]
MKDTQISSNIGTKQEKRFFEPLSGDYVKIDERSFEELLLYTSRLSKLINFYGSDDQVQGDWSHFFSDETVILASIILSNPNQIEKRFKSYLNKVNLFRQEAKKKKYLVRCSKEIHKLALDFNHWFVELKKIESFSETNLLIRAEIESAITVKLGASLKLFISESKALNLLENIDEGFDKIWGLTGRSDESVNRSEQSEVAQVFQDVFQTFYETLHYLRTKTPEYLDQSLSKDTHYPEVALNLAFLKLYSHAQENINSVVDKHIDYYYKQVLNQKVLGHTLDKVYLQIELDKESDSTMVPAGTRFYGLDKNTNQDVYYCSQDNLLANQVKIDKVYSLYVDRSDKEVSAMRINNVFFSNLPLGNIVSSSSNEIQSPTTLALFGESQSDKGRDEKSMDNAKVGFAISSPNLFLKGGSREIEVTLYFETKSFEEMMATLTMLSEQAELEAEDHEKLDSYFVKVFSQSFNLTLTTSQGWYEVEKYVVRKNPQEHSLTFLFDVNSTVESIEAFNPELHMEHFETNLPVLKFQLNSDSFVYGYTFMSFLKLEKAKINVEVSGMRDLVLYNDIGQLSPNSPFLPFGPTPKKGSYFLLGNNEVFCKSLDDLSLDIEWFDLPQSEGGFKKHYQAYNIGVDNTSYEISVSVLDNGNWKPEKQVDQQTLKLFRTEENGSIKDPLSEDTLHKNTTINQIDLKKIAQSPAYKKIEDSLSYTSTSQRGFLKLELTNPIYGFAHDVYQAVLSEAIIENAKGGLLKTSKKVEMPLQPYAPKVKSISLNYKSSSSISLQDSAESVDEGNGQVFHIHPFGIQKKFPNAKSIDNYVVPHYDFEGAAYLGLAGLTPPESVSILFDMVDEYSESSEEGIPEMDWDYLIDDEWKPLSTSRIVRDDTNKFLKTGVVTISLPSDITKESEVFGDGLYWLRISVRKNISSVSALRTLATNVVSASLDNVDEVGKDYLRKRLTKYSISRTVNHISGVRSIIQPLHSFDGRAEESLEKFNTRVGERLRHKGRAVTTWDYERIVLEEFPEIDYAACLSNMNSNSTNLPGSVLIVVSPKGEFSSSNTEPMASSELLMQIKASLASFGSSFVNLEVRNPTYERIKILCAVKFTEGHNHGFFIQKLNEDINNYLSGTLLSQSKKMGLGGTIHISDIMSYIRTLEYVDFITRFSMVQVARDKSGKHVLVDTAREGDKIGALKATKPWSILVPATEHQIAVMIDNEEQRSRQAGIDYLELGQDFIIED